MGCFGGTTNTSTTTTNSTPQSIKDLEKALAPGALDIASKPYQAYEGNRVAGFNSDQSTGMDMIRSLVSGAPDTTADAIGGVKSYMNAPGQEVQTERLVDENGQLGAISDYMNPYMSNVIDPAISKMMEQTMQRKKGLDATQHNAGAFGDARHGIAENQLFNDSNEAIGSVVGQLLSGGYSEAMGLRQSDQSNQLNTDITNANFDEAAIGREFTGATALPNVSSGSFNNNLSQINALLGVGQQQQANDQSVKDTDYEAFLREQEHPYRSLDALIGAINGIPASQQTTTTTSQPNNSGMGLIGSLLGGIF